MKEWKERSVRTLRQRVFRLRDNEDVLKEIEAARIGGAVISACGIGNLCGVVKTGTDLNGRVNPRPLNEGHVKALYDIIKLIGGKRDSESPILLFVSRKLLTDECVELMITSDARNPSHTMPRLELVRPNAKREDEIEDRLWTEWEDQDWIAADVLKKEQEELDQLRAERVLAILLNGNHRIEALLKWAKDITDERDRLMAGLRNGSIDRSDGWEELDKITELAKELTWRVIVYDGK